MVDCPFRGSKTLFECLGCRLLVTSGAERGESGWCDVDADEVLLQAPIDKTSG
jgi:hypothetical protein